MIEAKYTITPNLNFMLGNLIVGDLIDVLTGDVIIGPYCDWPKREPRYFTITFDEQGKRRKF